MMRQEQLAETARRIRLVAVDLDGTGLTDEKEFTPYTRRTLQALIDRGYQVVPTTGRSYYGLVENLLKLDGVKYAITADGAFVTEHETGTRIWEKTIPCETAASLADELLEDGNCVYYHRNDARCTHVMACTDRELYENHIWRPGFPDPKGLVTEHFGDCIRELNEDVVKIGLFFDLEAYSYAQGARQAIRPSERTVEERIPPRMAVRRGACLETPHVMMLADDPACTLIEPIGARKNELRKVYEGELMLGGGHIAGWAVEDPALLARIDAALQGLGSQEAFDAKYPEARGAKPLTLAVGDGNHSLASAKAYWEELKPTLTPEQRKTHPARWCLAEVCNVHSPAIEIEPIHRVLFNVDCGAVLLALISWSDGNMAGICFGSSKKQSFTLAGPHIANVLSFEDPVAPLTVGTIDEFIEYFMARHKEARVDYVHDEPAVRALTKQGGVGFLLPPFEKSDLFKGIVMGGVLPRKTFSMGHAEEKRYYIECRKIIE